MKKLVVLLLVIIMVISMAACAPAQPAGTTTEAPKDTTVAKDTTAAATTTTAGVDLSALPFCEPGTEKLTIGMPVNATVLDYNDNYYTKWLEEKTGIDLEFVFFSSDGSEAKQQLNLMIANKETLPDIIFNVLDDTLRAEYGAEGLLVDLTDYFETSSYWFNQHRQVMSEFEEKYMWARVTDSSTGEIYVFPSAIYGANPVYMGGINEVFAEKVGMDAAEIDTVAEVYEYMTKCLKEDPNGNGEADEIAWINYSGYRSNIDLWLINAYVLCIDDYLWNCTDGEIWTPYDTDEYRMAMIEMNKWYKEGLISPMSYGSLGNAEMKALIDTPECYKVAIYGGNPNLVLDTDSNPGATYGGLNVLQDETGKGGYGVLLDAYTLQKNASITSYCQNPELAFRLLDFMCETTTQQVARYGEENVNWKWIDGEALGLYDKHNRFALFEVMKDEWSTETKLNWHSNPIQCDASGSYDAGISFGAVSANPDPTSRTSIQYENTWAQTGAKQPEEPVYSLVYNSEENEVISEYQKLFKAFVIEARAHMVTGVIDPNDDAQWGKYLDELKANGLEDLLEAAQSAYDRMNG